jgi:hypothetical protein
VHEALMIEPTETENKDTLDRFADVLIKIAEEAKTDPDLLHNAPTRRCLAAWTRSRRRESWYCAAGCRKITSRKGFPCKPGCQQKGLQRYFKLGKHDAGGLNSFRCTPDLVHAELIVRAWNAKDLLFPISTDQDQRYAGVIAIVTDDKFRIYTLFFESFHNLPAAPVRPDPCDEGDPGTETGRGHRLVCTLPAGRLLEQITLRRFSRLGQFLATNQIVHVCPTDNDDIRRISTAHNDRSTPLDIATQRDKVVYHNDTSASSIPLTMGLASCTGSVLRGIGYPFSNSLLRFGGLLEPTNVYTGDT